jgi:hypothetical protein
MRFIWLAMAKSLGKSGSMSTFHLYSQIGPCHESKGGIHPPNPGGQLLGLHLHYSSLRLRQALIVLTYACVLLVISKSAMAAVIGCPVSLEK